MKYFTIFWSVFSLVAMVFWLPLDARAAHTISGAEYFIDDDPGEGNGISLLAEDGLFSSDYEAVNAEISTENLKIGPHYVYVRLQNEEGVWGISRKHLFMVTGEKHIIAAEYFIDDDPGSGEGISIDPEDGYFDGEEEDFNLNINTSLLDEGLHKVYVRTQDSEGYWGPARQYTFDIGPPATIVKAEYFIDDEPEPGNGISLNAVDDDFDSDEESLWAEIDSSTLLSGEHLISVRAQDSYGRWSNSFQMKTCTFWVGEEEPNTYPDAQDDSAETNENTAINIDVLTNDTDADGDNLSITAITQPGHGTAANNGEGGVTYTPDTDYTGTDSFAYTVSDGKGGNDTASVTIVINAQGNEESSTLLISNGTAFPGNTVTIELELINGEGVEISALASDISYDSDMLTNPTIEIGQAAEDTNKTMVTSELDENTLRFAIYSMTDMTPVPDGIVAMITFDVNVNAEIGMETQITQDTSASDSAANDVFIQGSSGIITIANACSCLGDCNMDDSVSIAEVQTAINQFMGTSEVQSCNDKDGDGLISISEVQTVVNNFLEGC